MAYVILPSRRRRPDVFELDHGHPLAQGLAFALLGNRSERRVEDSSFDLLHATYSSGGPVFNDTLQRNGITRFARGITPTTSGFAADTPTKIRIADGNVWTNAVWMDLTGWGDTHFLGTIGAGNSAAFLHMRGNGTVGVYLDAYQRPNVNAGAGYAALHHWAVTRNGSLFRFFRNGVQIGTASDANAFYGASWADVRKICVSNVGGTNFNHKIYDPVVYNRVLSTDEIKVLANPTDPMLEGLIRDKKPAPKHWHLGALPSDRKVKTVTPVVLRGGSIGGVSHVLPRLKRRPDVFTLDYSHPLAHDMVFGGLGRLSALENSSAIQLQTAYNIDTRSLIYNDVIERFGLNFDGSQRIYIPFLYDGHSPVTLSCFLLATVLSGDKYIFCASHTAQYFPVIGTRTGSGYPGCLVRSIISTESYSLNDSSVLAGSLNHVSLVFSNSVASLYVNGVHKGSSFIFQNNIDVDNITIGGWSRSGILYGVGQVFDPIIHNRALSPAEIALLADRTDPMLGGLIRESKQRTIYAYNAKHNIVGTQDANTLKWNWGE